MVTPPNAPRTAPVPAVVMAGDRGAARAVRGESKVFLELAGRPLVAHVVEVLQAVPEVSAVWVVGDAERLEAALSPLRDRLTLPLHVVSQFNTLYENAWESYRRVLPDAPPDGRDPLSEADLDQPVLYLSGDLPFATPQEISDFVRQGLAKECVYAVGFVEESSVEPFYPASEGEPGIHPVFFNISEGRVRQSNLHLVRPARLTNRHYIQEMYQHRYQKQVGNMIGLGWRIMRSESGGLRIAFFYALLHMASLFDRAGLRRTADRIRSWVPTVRVEDCVSRLLRGSFRLVVTSCGGCAVDIDNEDEYQAALARYDEWRESQRELAEALYGPPALPERATS
jgi:GTP:adenosylcobinamide-phosphate guanylyltransferase